MMTEVERLIEQALAIKKAWKRPESHPVLSERSWQEVLDGQPYPSLNVKNL